MWNMNDITHFEEKRHHVCDRVLPAIKVKVLGPPETLLVHGRSRVNLADHDDVLRLIHALLEIKFYVRTGGALIL